LGGRNIDDMKRLSPRSIDGATSRTLLVVEDPDSVMRHAVATGATESSPRAERARPESEEPAQRFATVTAALDHASSRVRGGQVVGLDELARYPRDAARAVVARAEARRPKGHRASAFL
jgi:hypothetical protein